MTTSPLPTTLTRLTCWCSMELAVPQNYCKTDTWPSWWQAEGSALSYATSPSRLQSALRSIWRGVLVWWHLDMKKLRAGLWGNSCCYWMGSVWGYKAKRSTPFGSRVAMCLSARVVAKISRPTIASTNIRSFLLLQASPQEELLQLFWGLNIFSSFFFSFSLWFKNFVFGGAKTFFLGGVVVNVSSALFFLDVLSLYLWPFHNTFLQSYYSCRDAKTYKRANNVGVKKSNLG